RSIARITLVLTLLLASFQAYGVASAIRDATGLIVDPDGWFVISATTTMVGGVFVLIFLCDLITRYGVGNGLALVLSVGILGRRHRNPPGCHGLSALPVRPAGPSAFDVGCRVRARLRLHGLGRRSRACGGRACQAR
ncbi:SecY family transport protein, partial [Staphylococcus aureus]|uniref:SecY family transport protein n=1 Tax=Staphylococcus aureus TaxID=1280 RepID=UPI001CB7D82F